MSASKAVVAGNMAESIEYELDMDSDVEGVEDDARSISVASVAAASMYSGGFKKFTYVNGRRYHSEKLINGEYLLPCDEREQDRLDLCHYIFLVLFNGKLNMAPLCENVKMVLDVGTGTGIWAIDFAGEFPDAHIIGTDISPMQPTWVPPQLTFEMVDMENPWEDFFKPNIFDYIHLRTMAGCFKDWDEILLQALKHAAPGGYVEIQDFGADVFHMSGNIPEGSKLRQYSELCIAAGKNAGRPIEVIRTLKERMLRLGFEDVHEHVYILPFGPWPKNKHMKELGRIGQVAITESMEIYSAELLSKYHGMELSDIKELCEKVQQDIKKTKGYYTGIVTVYGRKPLE